jgi:predicted protein tyrosine phosphatase
MINTTPITQFTQLLRAAELSQQKEVKMTIQQARLLSLALNEIMDKMNQDYESMFNDLKRSANPDVVSVQLDGGGFDSN